MSGGHGAMDFFPARDEQRSAALLAGFSSMHGRRRESSVSVAAEDSPGVDDSLFRYLRFCVGVSLKFFIHQNQTAAGRHIRVPKCIFPDIMGI